MDRPLTPGEIIDRAGLKLTPGQWRRAAAELKRMGYQCHPRSDGSMLILPPGTTHDEDEQPRYDAA